MKNINIKFSLVWKITILVVLAVFLSQVVQILSFEYFLKNSYLNRAKIKMNNAINIVKHDMQTTSDKLKKSVKFVDCDESILASIYFVNNYQNKKTYNGYLVDEEKKKILNQLLYRVKLSLNDTIKLYDNKGELVAYVFRTFKGYRLNFISYHNNKMIIFSKEEYEKEYKVIKNTNSLSFIHNDIVSNSITYKIQNSNLIMTAHRTIIENKSLVGHIELSKIYNLQYFDKISQQNGLKILINKSIKENPSKIAIFEKNENLKLHENIDITYTQRFVKTLDGKFNMIFKLDKKILTAQINQNRVTFLIIGLISLIVILTSIISILKPIFNNPIRKLMEQIKKIELKDYSQTKIVNTKDELEVIASSINDLSQTIHKREQEIKDINKNLHIKIIKELEKNKQQQLLMINQSRLTQMSEMMKMIAHQWRQPLNNISILTQTIALKYMMGKLTDKLMNNFKTKTDKHIEGMSNIIDDFQDFFKPQKEETDFCLNELITETLEMVNPTFFQYDLCVTFNNDTIININGFQNELGQTLINIINNAKDALVLNEIKNKKLNINLYREAKDIIIKITDNAGGIPDEIMDKIFDPYFSTKDEKNGTGLGLYMSKIIIEEHCHGKLTARNENGGAVLKIIL